MGDGLAFDMTTIKVCPFAEQWHIYRQKSISLLQTIPHRLILYGTREGHLAINECRYYDPSGQHH